MKRFKISILTVFMREYGVRWHSQCIYSGYIRVDPSN